MDNKELEIKLGELAKLKNTMSCIEDQMDTFVINIVHKDHPEIKFPDIYCPFDGKCEKSPFGFCVYNMSAGDDCLYCKKLHDDREQP